MAENRILTNELLEEDKIGNIRPETLEAEMLNLIDNIDARVNTIDKALAETKEGEFTSKIFALDNRAFYKHK